MNEQLLNRKFQIGDRVEMTDATKKNNSRVVSRLGTVVGYGKKYYWEIKVKRDGCKNPDSWHEDAWQKEGTG
jgi:hypothetical protein